MATIYDEPASCTCAATNTYTQSQINIACTAALKLASEKKTLGNDKYPHAYNDYEKFTFANVTKPFLEFPILESGEYEGGSPGADRVVIGSIAKDYESAVFCAIITHDGSSEKNGFVECTSKAKEGYAKGRDFNRDGRELVDRIDL